METRPRASPRALAGKEGLEKDVEAPAPAPLRQQSAADAITAGEFLPATIQDIEDHLAQSTGAVHPRGDGTGAADALASLLGADAKIDRWREATPAKRAERMARLRTLSASLQPLTDRLYDEFAPPHIRESSPRRPRLHAAWLSCIASAFSLDNRILVDCILGFVTVGASSPSGAFPEANPPIFAIFGKGPPSSIRFRGTPFADLDHAAWNDELAASAEERWTRGADRGPRLRRPRASRPSGTPPRASARRAPWRGLSLAPTCQ